MPRRSKLVAIDQSKLQPLLLGLAFGLLIAISAATFYVIDRASRDDEELAHAQSIQDRLTTILLVARRAESGQRGYLLSDHDPYLQDYLYAAPRVMPFVKELQDLSAGDPALTRTANQIRDLVTEKLNELDRTVTLQRNGNRDAALTLFQTNQGRDLMEELRIIVTQLVTEYTKLRAQRVEAGQRNNLRLMILSVVGTVLIVLIGGLSIFLVRRNARTAETARIELASTNLNLERIVAYRTADLTEANEEIQRFAYIVSHDLRSPLVNIMGFTSELEALRQDIFQELEKLRGEIAHATGQTQNAAETGAANQLGKDFDEAIGFIKTSIGNMDRLINAVLRLSREGRRQFHPEQVDMDALLDGISQTVSHRVTELDATLDVSKLPEVESDTLALQQIFSNLVDNALKYRRPEVKPQILVKGRLTATHAVYDVEDNGRGIDKADFQRVFELFRRAGKQDTKGEGIGLAHVRALVRRLGGTMDLKSELGQGSTFTVTLPRRWSVQNRSAA